MGRPPKYKTAEEREAARKDSRRRYYERNREKEKKRSLKRYHALKTAARAARAVKVKEVAYTPVLADTVAKFGPTIKLGRHASLQELAETLSSDLNQFTGSKSEGEVWDDLTCRLIAVIGKPRLAKCILLDMARKTQLADLVIEHAELGSREAWLRGQRRQQAALDNLAHKARRISQCLMEMSVFYRESGETLLLCYEGQTLLWQCT